jgi:hypothetical protein
MRAGRPAYCFVIEVLLLAARQVVGKNARKWYLQRNPCLKEVQDAEFLQRVLCSIDLR